MHRVRPGDLPHPALFLPVFRLLTAERLRLLEIRRPVAVTDAPWRSRKRRRKRLSFLRSKPLSAI